MIYVAFMQMKGSGLNDSKHYIQELQATHQQELAEVEKRWHQCLEQKLIEAEARHKEELSELNKEWHWERKVKNLFTQYLYFLGIYFYSSTSPLTSKEVSFHYIMFPFPSFQARTLLSSFLILTVTVK
jgi:hypothetical protein